MAETRSPYPLPGLTIEQVADGVVLVGELDTATVPQLVAALRATTQLPVVAIDLAGVAFIDSSGLRILIETHQDLDADGRRLVLRQPSRSVTRLFEISGVDGYLIVES